MYIRGLETKITETLQRGKSLLILGPRQVGKTTLLRELSTDLSIDLSINRVRQNYERDPSVIIEEIQALKKKCPLVAIDEIQKVPQLMDDIQYLVDNKKAQFILTGSSARKLTHSGVVNLLPGRLVQLRMDPLSLTEAPAVSLTDLLVYGSLPGILTVKDPKHREEDLASYVETYLEEEIRKEAVTRNMGDFNRFLECAAIESGQVVNLTRLSQDLGPTVPTISNYYQALVDTLIAERIEPLTQSTTRKKLLKSPRYLFFDLGVRRSCAREGPKLNREHLGKIFEQWVGLECLRYLRLNEPRGKILFWSDPDGPEVDWVVEVGKRYLPIEVKYSTNPNKRDAKHLETFLDEYKGRCSVALIVSQVERSRQVSERVRAVPWQNLDQELFDWLGQGDSL